MKISTSVESTNAEDSLVQYQDVTRAERSRLWSDDRTGCCRSCNRNFSQSYSVGCGQFDIHKLNRQGRTSAPETSLAVNLRAKISSLSNSTLFTYLKPYFSSSSTLVSNQPGISRSHEQKSVNQSDSVTYDEFSTKAFASVSSDISFDNNMPTASQKCSSILSTVPKICKYRNKTPLCPCFPQAASDSNTDTEDEESLIDVNVNIDEALKNRLAVTGQVPIQKPFVKPNQEMVIHKIVEYSYHLVPDMKDIYASSYYWGAMDRFKAEELLENKPEGTFLLRDSVQNDFLFSVSFRRFQRTLHARIEQNSHRFGFDIFDDTIYSADTITALIENYKDVYRCLFFEPQLTLPLHRNFVFSLQDLCRSTVASCTTYTGVSKLQIPQKLKQFIRQYYYTVSVRTVLKPHE